jgi:hypothetical protein
VNAMRSGPNTQFEPRGGLNPYSTLPAVEKFQNVLSKLRPVSALSE